jgi:uncharacterized membrane protein
MRESRRAVRDRVDPEPFAILAFLLAAAGLGVGFLRDKRGWIGGCIAGAAGILALLLLKMKIDNDVLREGEGVLQVEYGIGFYLAFLVFLCAAALNVFLFLDAKKQALTERIGTSL